MIRRVLEGTSISAVVAISCWNIWIFKNSLYLLPPTEANEIVLQEERYKQIREILKESGYQGPINFITNHDLTTREPTWDDKRMIQGQYVMVPWILVRNGSAVSGASFHGVPAFTVGDFGGGRPAELPEELEELYDSRSGLILFRRKTVP